MRRLRDAERQHERASRTPVDASATTSGLHGTQMPAREQAADAVAERHADDRERAEHLALRLRADEQRDADEADRDADEADAGDAHLAEEAERDHAR